MIYIIATITAHEGRHADLLSEFHANLTTVRAKRGCLVYDIAVHLKSDLPGQAPFDRNDMVIVEAWVNRASFEAHITDAVYREWFMTVYHLVANASMQILESDDASRTSSRDDARARDPQLSGSGS